MTQSTAPTLSAALRRLNYTQKEIEMLLCSKRVGKNCFMGMDN